VNVVNRLTHLSISNARWYGEAQGGHIKAIFSFKCSYQKKRATFPEWHLGNISPQVWEVDCGRGGLYKTMSETDEKSC